MNSVHEPGSRTMSKNLTQEKYQVEPGQKQAECTECTVQSQPTRPGHARPVPSACLPRAQRGPLTCAPPAARLPPPALHSGAPTAPHARAPSSLQRPPARPRTNSCALRARPAARPAPAQRLPSCPVLGHNTPRCIATQFLLAHCPSQVTIQNCIVTQFLSKLTSFTAIQFYVLQYNFSNPLPAIQYFYCNQPFQTCCNTISSLAI